METSCRYAPLRSASLTLFAALFAITLIGCAAEPVVSAPVMPEAAETPNATVAEEPSEDGAGEEPRTQAESCEWEGDALASTLPSMPGASEGDIETVIIGSWQHTHVDTGAGFEPLHSKDIRYVFPSTDRLLYCQHVPGITEHASHAADITLNGTEIVLPGGAPGFIVTNWSEDTMVWGNNMDGSKYLLQRR